MSGLIEDCWIFISASEFSLLWYYTECGLGETPWYTHEKKSQKEEEEEEGKKKGHKHSNKCLSLHTRVFSPQTKPCDSHETNIVFALLSNRDSSTLVESFFQIPPD